MPPSSSSTHATGCMRSSAAGSKCIGRAVKVPMQQRAKQITRLRSNHTQEMINSNEHAPSATSSTRPGRRRPRLLAST